MHSLPLEMLPASRGYPRENRRLIMPQCTVCIGMGRSMQGEGMLGMTAVVQIVGKSNYRGSV
jgi:hypothetical protein